MATTPVQVKTGTTAVQVPTADNTQVVLRQLKEVVEVGQRLRGDPNNSFVRVSELVSAGVIRLVGGVIQPPTATVNPTAPVPSTRIIATTAPITGGGDLSADRTIALANTAVTPGSYTNLSATIGADGRITAASSGSGGGVTLAAAILADSPFAFWKCDDASTSLADSSGNGFNLTTVVGTPTFQSGLLIPTLSSSQFVNFAGYSASTTAHGFQLTSGLGRTLPFTTWTAEFVVSMFGGTTGIVRFVDWRTSGTTAILAIYNNGGPLSMALNNTNIPLLPTGIFGIGKPYHIVVTCSTAAGTSTLTSYVNGVRYGVAVTGAASTASGGTSIVGLGDYTYGGPTAGVTIGYVALFPTVLSAARIGAHAQAAGLLD